MVSDDAPLSIEAPGPAPFVAARWIGRKTQPAFETSSVKLLAFHLQLAFPSVHCSARKGTGKVATFVSE
eukprot:1137549-Pleurochrysis_carterae.AAC.1